jgi:hypothetical protein
MANRGPPTEGTEMITITAEMTERGMTVKTVEPTTPDGGDCVTFTIVDGNFHGLDRFDNPVDGDTHVTLYGEDEESYTFHVDARLYVVR